MPLDSITEHNSDWKKPFQVAAIGTRLRRGGRSESSAKPGTRVVLEWKLNFQLCVRTKAMRDDRGQQTPFADNFSRARSFLVIPALRPDRVVAGHKTDADFIVVDLEDSVPPESKAAARFQWVELSKNTTLDRLTLRINTPRSVDGLRDLISLMDAASQPKIIHVPKVESAWEVQYVSEILSDMNIDALLCAIIETPRGIINVASIAGAGGNLFALCFGAADYAANLGIAATWDSLHDARNRMVVAAAAAQIVAIDSPCFDLGNDAAARIEMRRARELGYHAKVAIHPKHVDMINEIFGPTPQEIEWARKVVAGFRDTDAAILVIDGMMVGPPALKRAHCIVSSIQSVECSSSEAAVLLSDRTNKIFG